MKPKFNSNANSVPIIDCPMLEDAGEITGRNHSERWEIEVVKKINEFKLTTACGAAALKEGWFGMVFENYIVSPYGLANYLFEIYSKEIFIREIWPLIPGISRYSRPVDEFTYNELHLFREWVNGKYFYAKAFGNHRIDIVGDRREDLVRLRKVGLTNPRESEKFNINELFKI